MIISIPYIPLEYALFYTAYRNNKITYWISSQKIYALGFEDNMNYEVCGSNKFLSELFKSIIKHIVWCETVAGK